MSKKFFVTGTDTNVGKTIVSCSILRALIKKNFKVIGYKPVACGSKVTNNGIKNDDVIKLLNNSNIKLKYNQINLYSLISYTSPHIASLEEKKKISLIKLSKNLRKLEKLGDYIIIEGAGGWLTPLSKNYFFSDWVIYEKIPVILVVGLKLGCLNHALLTFKEIKNSGLKIVGWIANGLNIKTYKYKKYISSLKKILNIPLLGEIPWINKIEFNNIYKYINVNLL